jgi:hypothetical protein
MYKLLRSFCLYGKKEVNLQKINSSGDSVLRFLVQVDLSKWDQPSGLDQPFSVPTVESLVPTAPVLGERTLAIATGPNPERSAATGYWLNSARLEPQKALKR